MKMFPEIQEISETTWYPFDILVQVEYTQVEYAFCPRPRRLKLRIPLKVLQKITKNILTAFAYQTL